MKRSDLAKVIVDAVYGEERGTFGDAAVAVAAALGVTLDPESDPRYDAAMRVLLGSDDWDAQSDDVIARAIVAAMDAQKGT